MIKPNNIAALCIVSASEIAQVMPDFTYDWAENNPHEFQDVLYQFGMDTTQPIELQENLTHRNRLNKVVQCHRWVGSERTDKEWLESGFASKEAKDKASGSRLLQDLYRMRGYEK